MQPKPKKLSNGGCDNRLNTANDALSVAATASTKKKNYKQPNSFNKTLKITTARYNLEKYVPAWWTLAGSVGKRSEVRVTVCRVSRRNGQALEEVMGAVQG